MRKLGLALGGGGARGLAHVGILKVLEEADIPVCCLAGTSMGGIIAALYASGKPVEELEAIACRMASYRELVKLVDLNPPRRGLLEGKRVRDYLAKLLGEHLTFEELCVPLALTAVDLVHACEVVLREGPLLPAVLATSAMPGLLPPQRIGGTLMVDGGILNNVPADHARELGAEVVIAVDVQSDPCNEKFEPAHAERSNPLAWMMPEMLQDFYRSELIMTAALTKQRLERAQPELVLRPRIAAEVNMFSGFTHAVELIELGEAVCRNWLPFIRQLVFEEGDAD